MKKTNLILIAILLILAACQREPKKKVNVDWTTFRIAYDWFGKQQDSAFYYFNQVTAQSRDSLQVAMAYSNMAKIQYRAGDFYGAQESLVSSLKFLNEHHKTDHATLASNYNDLGLIRADLDDQNGAIDFYRQNLRFAQDTSLKDLTWNNIAYAYQQKKEYDQAIAIYQRLLNKERQENADYARALTNLATAQWLRNPSFKAAPPLLKALRIRQKAKDDWGQNSSFAHLADYYRSIKPDSALGYAKSMYEIAKRLESPDDQLQALGKLVDLSPVKHTKIYFGQFKELNDSLQTARNAAKNQFALIRYKVEKSKADNLKLQKDITDKKYQLIRQNIRFYGALSAFIFITIFALLWYGKRKRQQEQDKQLAVTETREKASKKVHDTLANDAYLIMKRLQNDVVLDKNWLLYHVKDLYIRARDISYDIIQRPEKDFYLKISALLKSFSTDDTRVSVVGNNKDLWDRVDPVHQFELKYIIQELMVNMQKHSEAHNVILKFEVQDNRCLLTYFDDGIGLNKDFSQKNGLTNTGNRINAIGGVLTFDTGIEKGLQISLSFPIK
ncbi:ATP-binding protein [Mucilaginibacter sp. 14171R-50]|uniref:tetratricopeptide repeat-containing sensor histidine kinase n=1 Tax=Mucilaginibacter sp. 14171R-50 TaxID=2703789 RepID=UPI00138C0970|nr:tetratricopeptide repeat-containing sensor histidine kinase [Mucilaginibacter sp. 14171R-50]QHS56531.1 ATP-binding protein [Mucilaginibacter sp. 14171R-50]